MDENTAKTLIALSVLGLVIFVYMFPTFIAGIRGKKNTAALAVLNLMFGWTLLGWGAALIWAFYREAKDEVN